MKKNIIGILAVLMALSAGCTAPNSVISSAASSKTPEPASSEVQPETETPETTETPEAAGEFEPAGDYEDEWSQRAGLHIDKREDGTYAGTVHWGASAYEAAVWTFTGEWNPEESTLSYSDCRSTFVKYSETGEETEEVNYEEGTGAFRYEDGVFLWEDDNDPAGLECRFIKIEE